MGRFERTISSRRTTHPFVQFELVKRLKPSRTRNGNQTLRLGASADHLDSAQYFLRSETRLTIFRLSPSERQNAAKMQPAPASLLEVYIFQIYIRSIQPYLRPNFRLINLSFYFIHTTSFEPPAPAILLIRRDILRTYTLQLFHLLNPISGPTKKIFRSGFLGLHLLPVSQPKCLYLCRPTSLLM